MNDGGANPWLYFTGREGNIRGFSRRGCQFYDGKKWRRCFSWGSGNFDETGRYRRPIDAPTTQDKPLADELLPVEILIRREPGWAVARLKGGKFAWMHDGTVEVVADLRELPFCWIGWPGPAKSVLELDLSVEELAELFPIYQNDPCAKILIEGLK